MSGNIFLLIISFVVICVITIYLYKKWPDLDIIDLYIVFILLNFGFVPFIRGLYFGKDIIFDFNYSNKLAILLVFVQIFVILLIIKGLLLIIPTRLNKCLQIRYLIERCSYANKYILFVVYGGLILFPIISYFVYGVKPYIMPKDFDKIGKDLPYWFTSIRTIQNYIAFWIFLGFFGNIVKSKNYSKLLWSILTFILVLSVTISGRRFFVNMIVVWIIFWAIYYKINIFRWRYVTVSLLLIGVLFLSSNIYQTYRDDFLFKVGNVNAKKLKNPFMAALNYQSTIHNMQIRAGTWEFNYLVFDQQINKSGITANGDLTVGGF